MYVNLLTTTYIYVYVHIRTYMSEDKVVKIPIKTSVREMLRKESQIKGETYSSIIERLIIENFNRKKQSAFEDVVEVQ